ncbi:MAG: hypothetical protein HQL71_05895 [Magnetococcales bacterium]|nr:hypothetical protein [Magnetococcales bacterium]
MIKFFLWLMLALIPVCVIAGEPPPSIEKPKELKKQKVDQLSPHIVMGAVPDDNKNLLPTLAQRIKKRLKQTGFILNHPPPNNYIIGSLENRNIMGRYDQILLKTGHLAPETNMIIHRPGPLLIDPKTEEKMGILSLYIGRVKTQYMTKSGTVALITDSLRAIIAKDMLLQMPSVEPEFKIHNSAATTMEGRVLRMENNMEMAGSDQLFIVGLGRRNRATLGLMLPIYQSPAKIVDPVTKKMVSLPTKTIGHGVLIRVGERASIAFLADSTRPIRRGDIMATAIK